jgi:hypothetical protein
MNNHIVILSIALSLTGCATIDSGEIDYRRAERSESAQVVQAVADYPSKNCDSRMRTDKQKKSGEKIICPPLLGSRLFRQNVGTGDAIAPHDVYSIRLEHGLIAFMLEPKFSTRRLVSGKDPLRRVGEVVVLANTFEFPASDGSSTDTKNSTRFTDLGELSQSKVVYYSPDVEAGQDLNFSNIPLQEPLEYHGRPVGIQIIVLELDRVSAGVGALLKKLAGLGVVSNAVPGGKGAELLLSLGASLVSQNNDDIIFEYRMVLDPAKSNSLEAGSAPFEAGRYVMIREDERLDNINWRNFYIDHNTGKLFKYTVNEKTGAPAEVKLYDKNTYFTINVIRHPDGSTPAHYDFRSFEDLGAMISAQADERDRPLASLGKEIEQKLVEARGERWATNLISSWQAAENAASIYVATVAPADISRCTLLPSLAVTRDVKETSARLKSVQFARLLQEARDAKETVDGKEVGVFDSRSQMKILANLMPYFAPFDGGQIEQSKFLDPDAFALAYAGVNAGTFSEALVKEARREAEENSCETLVANGYATLK